MKNTVIKYLNEISQKNGNRVAISVEDRNVSFAQYNEKAKRIGTFLISRCCYRNMPIAVYLPKGEIILEVFMGILYSGNYYAPIPYNSPNNRANQMVDILEGSYIITQKSDIETVKQWGVDEEKIIQYQEAILYDYEDELIFKNIEKVIDTDPAYLLFTSGSTGVPKGVVVPHKAIIDRIEWMAEKFEISENNILASQAPFHFDASMPDIYINIIKGAKLIIPPEKLFSFPSDLLMLLEKENVNTLIWVPSALTKLTYKNAIEKYILSDLKLVIFCGEVMHNKYLNILRRIYPATTFINMYGPTETTYACTYFTVKGEFLDNDPLPIGEACGNTDVFLLDENNNRIERQKEIGEICIRGSSLAIGYYRNSKTGFENATYQNCYFERIYRTGDLGFLNDENDLMFVGRKDNQIKHLGYRIELGEIENAIQSLKEISYACAMYDSIQDKIVLFYETEIPHYGKKEIIQGIVNRIPKYMYPSEFVQLQRMPFNINGKIDRQKLKKQMQERVYERKD